MGSNAIPFACPSVLFPAYLTAVSFIGQDMIPSFASEVFSLFSIQSCHKIPPAMAPIPKRTINPPSIPCKPASTFPLILPRKRQVSHARKIHQLPVPPASPSKRQHPCPRVTPPKIPKEAKAVTNARIVAGFVTAIKKADKNRREYLPGVVWT